MKNTSSLFPETLYAITYTAHTGPYGAPPQRLDDCKQRRFGLSSPSVKTFTALAVAAVFTQFAPNIALAESQTQTSMVTSWDDQTQGKLEISIQVTTQNTPEEPVKDTYAGVSYHNFDGSKFNIKDGVTINADIRGKTNLNYFAGIKAFPNVEMGPLEISGPINVVITDHKSTNASIYGATVDMLGSLTFNGDFTASISGTDYHPDSAPYIYGATGIGMGSASYGGTILLNGNTTLKFADNESVRAVEQYHGRIEIAQGKSLVITTQKDDGTDGVNGLVEGIFIYSGAAGGGGGHATPNVFFDASKTSKTELILSGTGDVDGITVFGTSTDKAEVFLSEAQTIITLGNASKNAGSTVEGTATGIYLGGTNKTFESKGTTRISITGKPYMYGVDVGSRDADYAHVNESTDATSTMVFTGDLNISIEGSSDQHAEGIRIVREAPVTVNNATIDVSGKDAMGIHLAGPASFSAKGTVDITSSNVGISVQKTNDPQSKGATALFEKHVTINAPQVVLTTDTEAATPEQGLIGGTVEFKQGLTAIGYDGLIVTDSGSIKINEGGAEYVQFVGRTEVGNSSGVLSMTLGTASPTADAKVSYWDVTQPSTVTSLALMSKSALAFVVSKEAVNNADAPLLTVRDQTAVPMKTGENGAKIGLYGDGAVTLTEGDQIHLIAAPAGFIDEDTKQPLSDEVLQSVKLGGLEFKELTSIAREETVFLSDGDFELKLIEDGQKLIAHINNLEEEESQVNPQTDSLMESSLSAYAAMFASDDLVTDAVIRGRIGTKRGGMFAAARAGRWDYDTHGDLEANIVSGVVGYAHTLGATELGGFIEMGHSTYETRDYSTEGVIEGHADGKHNYGGLGLYVNQALPVEGWHLTGYVKAGLLQNKFDVPIAGQTDDFDRTSMYWGAQLGTYYDLTVGSFTNRFYLTYYYDGRESENYTFADQGKVKGARFDYDALSSHRVQVGTLFEYRFTETARPYFGLAYEQVIDAKAEGTAHDAMGALTLRSSDMEGGTGIISAGWTYVPADSNFSCDFGLNGYIGTYRGISAEVKVGWTF